jgi:hypothetical protein
MKLASNFPKVFFHAPEINPLYGTAVERLPSEIEILNIKTLK